MAAAPQVSSIQLNTASSLWSTTGQRLIGSSRSATRLDIEIQRRSHASYFQPFVENEHQACECERRQDVVQEPEHGTPSLFGMQTRGRGLGSNREIEQCAISCGKH